MADVCLASLLTLFFMSFLPFLLLPHNLILAIAKFTGQQLDVIFLQGPPQ